MIFKHETTYGAFYFENEAVLREAYRGVGGRSQLQCAFLVISNKGEVLKNRYDMGTILDRIAIEGLMLVQPLEGDSE